MRIRFQLILGACVVFLLLGIAIFLRSVSSPRIVARAVSPDGVEMEIVQQCNWEAEPFTTSFVYRKPGRDWGWFYFDHQDWYWAAARISLDTNQQVAVFYRGGAPAVTFAWAAEVYTLHRWNRTLTGAQERLPASWRPQMSVYDRRR